LRFGGFEASGSGIGTPFAIVAGSIGGPLVIREGIVALGHLDQKSILATFAGIVLGQLGAQTPRLNSHHGINVRIEVLLASKDFCCNLILLWG
jgi:hypothetical protein